ncbi:MAG: presqualene diphosphate synthase HpnD [Alphaproteobacteria bacterium]
MPGARDAVRAIATGAGSSFHWALRLLPRNRREGMYAVYAFCRTVDDIADGPDPVDRKLAALAEWREEIRRLYAGAPRHVVARALVEPVRRFALHESDFLALIDGMVMDASGRMCAPPLLDLELYCRRGAGAVGMLSASIFGVRRPEGRSLALSLGQALQFVNFLRDFVEDADQGRLYVPRELLEQAGIETRDSRAFLRHPKLPMVAEAMAAMAEERFRAARRVLQAVPPSAARPAWIMLETYRYLLSRLRRRGFAPADLDRPVRLGRLRLLGIAVKAVLAHRTSQYAYKERTFA